MRWLLGGVGMVALVGLVLGFYGFTRTAPPLYGTVLETPHSVADVTLAGAGGERVAFSDFEGDLVAVFFGFTHCPDVCPLTLGRLANLYEDMGEPKELSVVMVTVDPTRDTPEVVQAYASNFHPDFVGLGGTPEQIADAARTFFIGYNEAGNGVVHTDMVILVDREGQMRLVYGQDKILRLEDDLREILAGRAL